MSLSSRFELEFPALMTQGSNGLRPGWSERQPDRGQYLATSYQWKLKPGLEAEVVHLSDIDLEASLDLSSKIGGGIVNWSN